MKEKSSKAIIIFECIETFLHAVFKLVKIVSVESV